MQDLEQAQNQEQYIVSTKVLKIYYKEQLQILHYYPGTTQIELEQTIRSLFDIRKNTNLIFLNEDGLPIALSSSIPTNIQLSLQVKEIKSINFHNQELQTHENIKKIKDSNRSSSASSQIKTLQIKKFSRVRKCVQKPRTQSEGGKRNDTRTKKTSEIGQLKFQISKSCLKNKPTLGEDGKTVTNFNGDCKYTDLQIQLNIEKNKRYYFQYTFEKLTCCMSAYLFTKENNQEQGDRNNISFNFGCEVTKKLNNVIVGIAIDTVKNQWHIVNPSMEKSVKSYEINFFWKNSQMALWTKHSEAVCKISDLMEYPNYL